MKIKRCIILFLGFIAVFALTGTGYADDDRRDYFDEDDDCEHSFDEDDDCDDSYKGRKVAFAEIYSCADKEDESVRVGRAVLTEQPSEEGVKTVKVSMKVKGLSPGKHAVHIHETAKCEPCGAAGGHFDPGPVGLPNPDGNHPFHSGDLVNIKVKRNGTGKLNAITTRVTLSSGPLSLFDDDGSAFIIHVNEDTYCPDGEEAGCAGGSRAACGIIEML